MHKLTNVYLSMLNNMWDIENQLILELPKMIDTASHPELRSGLANHLEETRNHKVRLEELLQHHNQALTYERDLSFESLLQSAALQLSLIEDVNVKDAYLIASARTVEHLEISRYETLVEWAKELGDELGSDLLRKTLSEEHDAHKKLTAIAQGGLFSIGLNEQAVISGEDT